MYPIHPSKTDSITQTFKSPRSRLPLIKGGSIQGGAISQEDMALLANNEPNIIMALNNILRISEYVPNAVNVNDYNQVMALMRDIENFEDALHQERPSAVGRRLYVLDRFLDIANNILGELDAILAPLIEARDAERDIYMKGVRGGRIK